MLTDFWLCLLLIGELRFWYCLCRYGKMSENGWVVICPTLTMCPLHLSNGGSTILMLSSVMLKGYELLAYTTTGALGTGFRYS